MKKTIALLLAVSIVLCGCGKPMETDKKEYPTYGLFSESMQKSKDVCYDISVGNVMWSIILMATIIAPV